MMDPKVWAQWKKGYIPQTKSPCNPQVESLSSLESYHLLHSKLKSGSFTSELKSDPWLTHSCHFLCCLLTPFHLETASSKAWGENQKHAPTPTKPHLVLLVPLGPSWLASCCFRLLKFIKFRSDKWQLVYKSTCIFQGSWQTKAEQRMFVCDRRDVGVSWGGGRRGKSQTQLALFGCPGWRLHWRQTMCS